MNACLVMALGQIGYAEAWDLQKRIHMRVAAGELPDMLLLLEHPHVYTLGRRGRKSDILLPSEGLERLGVSVHFTDRGGEATYHGPGQLVGYPIVSLRRWGGGVRMYVQALEQTLITALGRFGIAADSGGKPTGVWVDDAKIGAIGVRISGGVTMHGFALNVCPDLTFFEHIVPCGIPDGRITSMANELGDEVGACDVMDAVEQAFSSEFGMRLVRGDADTLWDAVRCPAASD